MNYLNTMGNVLSFTPFQLTNEHQLKRLQYYCIINVLILGVVYGCSAAFFSGMVLAERGVADTGVNFIKIILAGIPTAFFMHAGASLFIWVFLKAMGGKSDFMTSYFHIGVASISLWPLAPFVAILQLGNHSGLLVLFSGIFCAYAFAVNINIIKQAFRLSALRMALATSVTLVYITCFLYLWV